MSAIRPKRFFYVLDGIRGIASLLVVLRHMGIYFTPVSFQESYLAVDIFFLLSGVVISNAYEHRLEAGMAAIQFAKIRLTRIYPLYFLGSAIMLGAISLGLAPHVAYLPEIIVLALFVIPSPITANPTFALDGPSWSLYLELIVNFFYGWLSRRLNTRLILLILSVSAAGLLVIAYMHHNLNAGDTQKAHLVGYFRVGYSFFMGVLVYRWYHSYPNIQETPSNIVTWLLLAIVAGLLMAEPSLEVRPYYDFLAVTVAFPALIYAALWVQPTGLTARMCAFVGAISYAIYVLHVPLSTLIIGLLGSDAIKAHAPFSGAILLIFLMGICWLIDKLYDTPVRRYLTKIFINAASKATLQPVEK